MKARHFTTLITALLTCHLTADTIVLKSGKTYEGKIISEDEKSYLVEIQVTKSIKDERRIPKDDVEEIIQEAKDAKDYETVKNLVPTPDRLSDENYQQRISAARAFLKKHRRSKHKKTVETILATLEKEQRVIASGGIKLNGQLISSSDMDANAYDIDARILLLDMEAYTAKRQYQKALRKWETLENDYPLTPAYQKSLQSVPRILSAYKAELSKLIASLDERTAKRQSNLTSLEENDRARAEALINKKRKSYEELIDHEQKNLRTKWMTVDPYQKKAMEHNLRSVDATLSSLSSKNSSSTKLAGPTFRSAWFALAENNLEEAANLIQKLQSMRLPEKYTAPLVSQLNAKKADKAAADKAAKEQAEKELRDKQAAEKAAKEAEAKKNKGRRNRK